MVPSLLQPDGRLQSMNEWVTNWSWQQTNETSRVVSQPTDPLKESILEHSAHDKAIFRAEKLAFQLGPTHSSANVSYTQIASRDPWFHWQLELIIHSSILSSSRYNDAVRAIIWNCRFIVCVMFGAIRLQILCTADFFLPDYITKSC